MIKEGCLPYVALLVHPIVDTAEVQLGEIEGPQEDSAKRAVMEHNGAVIKHNGGPAYRTSHKNNDQELQDGGSVVYIPMPQTTSGSSYRSMYVSLYTDSVIYV